jgi:iron complex outermembrane receptor protein
MNTQIFRPLCCLSMLLCTTHVIAQDQQNSTKTPQKRIEHITVVAHPLSGEGLAQAVDVLEGAELARKRATNIGATLAKQPGIHSAPFGNAVGRPIIHGLSGPRVRIMEDRIDTLDVSVTSGDHAVSVEPFIAERIEVLKGASTLLYGTGAIGGVVDVHAGRIPHSVPVNGFSGGAETRFDNNTNGNTTALKLNGGKDQFAWHLDGTRKDGDDYEIPGFTESAQFRAAEELEEAASGEAHEEGEEVQGILPGSFYNSTSTAVGASYLPDWGIIGVSVSQLEADYGLPGGHGGHEGEGEEAVPGAPATPILDMNQTRTDFELGVKNPFGSFISLNVRAGYNDYEHQEIEPDGEVATTFTNKAWESRVELVHESADWTNVFGLQQTNRAFSSIGEEAFIPPVDTSDSGLFWLGERSFESFDFETGLRVGRTTHDPEAGTKLDFSTYAVSIGAVIPLDSGVQFGLTADLSSRAPVAEELYSNGPHLTTNSFEIGDITLDNEDAFNLSASMQYVDDIWSATLTSYYTQFSDFIYQQRTGGIVLDLPVVAYRQADATFYGIDVDVSAQIFNGALFNQARGGGERAQARLNVMFDYVNAELDVTGNSNIPRLPPMRFGLGVEGSWGRVSGAIDYLRVSEQDNVADLELVTDGYNDLTAHVEYALPVTNAATVTGFLQGRNLTDEEQRIHTSFINAFAPAPGRSIELGLRLEF